MKALGLVSMKRGLKVIAVTVEMMKLSTFVSMKRGLKDYTPKDAIFKVEKSR